MLAKYLKYKRHSLILALICISVFLVSFALFKLPIAPLLYPIIVCLCIGIVYIISDYNHQRKIFNELTNIELLCQQLICDLPSPDSVTEEKYQEIITDLDESRTAIRSDAAVKYSNMVDYYTVWAHQIKTPIAAMRLNLQNSDTPASRQLAADLNRIESYVNMVLTFLRLDSESTDYVIKSQSLDDIIKTAVRKFSRDFITKKISLDYQETQMTVITDSKWLGFVIEQVLSNAVKYTNEGYVSIYMDTGTLCIKDTGIGIASADLPRIFENGFTGFNGRESKQASGIGLYLCKRICDNLGHKISAESIAEEGTTIKIKM